MYTNRVNKTVIWEHGCDSAIFSNETLEWAYSGSEPSTQEQGSATSGVNKSCFVLWMIVTHRNVLPLKCFSNDI